MEKNPFSWHVLGTRTTAACLLFAVHLAFPARAHAQARAEFIPSLSLFTVYDDNILARVEGGAGQILQFRPSFEGSYESPTVRLLGLYSFDAQRSNFSSLNTVDARRHALGETRLRTSPFTTLAFTMRYDRSETPGEIDFDSGILGERRQAERLELTPTLARRFGPRTVMTAGYDWTTENLVDGERGTLHTGRTSLAREVSTRTTLSGSYVGRSFVDDVANHSSHAALFGWSRELAPGTRFTVFAGPKITSYRGLTPDVTAGFARTTSRVRLALDYWHGETIVLGIQGPVAVDGVTGRVTWPVTRRFEFGTHAGVSDVSSLDSRTSTIYRGTLVGSWSPGGLYTVAASYGLDFQQDSIRNDRVVNGQLMRFDDRILRHVFRVGVTVAPRYGRSILPPDEAARAQGVSR
ncbi:MAG: hypothetical protein HW394_154 [Acidobacteria bacterium]|nr:hypothetical protein [Acidobacteriota bacterium]